MPNDTITDRLRLMGIAYITCIENGQLHKPEGKGLALMYSCMNLHTHQHSMDLLDIVYHNETPPYHCCWYH